MTDQEFLAWLKGWSAAIQGCDFGPIVAVFRNSDGTLNRERTLEGPCWGNLPASCRKKLLKAA
jgi:hypothetical protein